MTIASGEADHPDGPEPRDGDRVRVGQVAHRRMEDRRPEHQVGDQVDRVDRAAGDVRAVEVLDRVDLVGDDEQDERAGQQPERRGPGARRRQQAHRHADQQQVRDRVGEADADDERIEVSVDDLRLDEERP